jgi:Putative zinc-finger
MDPKENNEESEAKDLRREELLARRLAQALDERRPSGANDCPDAEMIAAYAEQVLDPDESARCENHFAGCARCRTILRVLTASADTPLAAKEVAHLGEMVAGAGSVELTPPSSRPQRPRLIDWRLRWLVPALGLASALAVLLVLRPSWRATTPSNSELLVAQAPKQELPLPPSTSEAARVSRAASPVKEKQKEEKPSGKNSARSPDSAAPNSSVEALAKRRVEDAGKLDAISPQADKKLTEDQGSGRVQPTPPLPAVPSAPPPAAQVAPQLQANVAPNAQAGRAPQPDSDASAIGGQKEREKQAVRAESEPAEQSGATPPRKQGAAESRLNEQKAQAFALARPVQKDAAMLKAPAGTALWRGELGGKIERSLDDGKTWVPQASPSNEDWLGGAAVSDSVCWLIGRHGAIARTMDGEHWQRVPSPPAAAAPSGVLPDWVSVTAADGQSATITAADGRKFATADGGKTWRPQ